MKTRLLSLVGVLVFVSVAIHLAVGITGLAGAISGDGTVLLPVLYLLGGLAALALLAVVTLTPATTTAYAAGAGLMVLFLFAYADVHAFGVAESTLGIELHDHGGDGYAHDAHGGHGDENGHGHSHDGGDDHEHGGESHGTDHDHGHSGEGHSHDHGGEDHAHDGEKHDPDDASTASVLAEHLRGDAYALVSKTAEAAAAVLFAALLVLDR